MPQDQPSPLSPDYPCPHCGRAAATTLTPAEAAADRAARKEEWKQASPATVAGLLLYLVGTHNAEATRRAGEHPPCAAAVVALAGLPDNQLLVDYGDKLFRVTVEALPPDEAHRLRLYSIHQAEQLDAHTARGRTPEERLLRSLGFLRS